MSTFVRIIIPSNVGIHGARDGAILSPREIVEDSAKPSAPSTCKSGAFETRQNTNAIREEDEKPCET
jgi:hypothetical protein